MTHAPKPGQKPNRLAKETSPYLRLHQWNPVDWYPWGAEALAAAKAQDKPIFLSIGYAACHWCHVMAHESFEDPAIAAVMNEHFICIKVDREERPDIDEIYMGAVQAMGMQGGWPLSVWLTPDGKPFYGGTYFPPEDGNGRPGFRRVLERLAQVWREERDDVLRGAREVSDHMQQALAPKVAPGEPTAELLAQVLPQAEAWYDAEYGGFSRPPGYAPKFPSAIQLRVLLRLPGEKAREMCAKTLAAMRSGGIYDQLGGGFHRYSTDRRWLVPHFEKMLYDNALLVPCYLEAGLATGDADCAAVARETLDWLLREMRHERGGFFSSQDAQSEGVEGRFFVWQKQQVDDLLGADAALACGHFGVTEQGNWEHQNVLVLAQRADALAAAAKLPADAVQQRLVAARAALLAAREQRVHPAIDDKILCAWNGLAISALAAGHRVLGDERYLAAARQAATFLLTEMVEGGRCKRSWHSGKAQLQGYLEDHAMLADGLLSLFEVDADPRWLAASREILRAIEEHFLADDGSFYFTADDHEVLLARSKSAIEGSTPPGIAVAALAFLRAGLLLGEPALYDRGVAALRANHELLARSPGSVPSLVLALQFHLADPREVVVAGEPGDARTQALLHSAWRAFPGAHVTALVHDGNREALARLSKVFDGKLPQAGVPAAYVCRRGLCEAPVTDPARLAGAR
ncbi:MAG TPA: thioredoxin domain-containing protein [Planctomycetota bacterium]|nr:thioredoxin domain-containing protein [Planctomycetota bacterium]